MRYMLFIEKFSGYYNNLNSKSLLAVTINGTLSQYVTVASGVSDLSYKFKAINLVQVYNLVMLQLLQE